MDNYIESTKSWVKDFVIAHDLCPFAGKPFKLGRIRYRAFEGTQIVAHLEEVKAEMMDLAKANPKDLETSLLIFPESSPDFLDYLDEVAVVEKLLVVLDLEGTIQVATFHPKYQFADEAPNSVTHRTNRSPFPMIHLIREESITKAVDSYPDIDSIPERNKLKMKDLFES